MQVVKPVGWQCLLKQPSLIGDSTVSYIRSPVDWASLIPVLEIMVQLDLVMMDLELEVIIKHCARGVGWHYSIVRAEVEGEFGVESIEKSVEHSLCC